MRIYDQNIWGNFSKENKIANRNRLLTGEIFSHDPDVLFFQECNPKSSRAGDTPISALLAPGYAEAAIDCADHNFTPVFYHTGTMTLLDSGWELFEGKNDALSKSFTWALLEEKKTGARGLFVSTHFWWRWDGEEDEIQRAENARQLVKKINELTAKYDVPVFVGGDLNSGIQSHQGFAGVDEMRRLGMKDTREIAAETTDCMTCHPYPVLGEDGNYTAGGQPIKIIDYIFTFGKQPSAAKRFTVLTDEVALTCSDHCPLIFDFEF